MAKKDHDSDIDDIDYQNFKGIYYGDDNKKYQDPVTGAHFEYYDLCKRLSRLKEKRKTYDAELGLPTDTPPMKSFNPKAPPKKQEERQKQEEAVIVFNPPKKASQPPARNVSQ